MRSDLKLLHVDFYQREARAQNGVLLIDDRRQRDSAPPHVHQYALLCPQSLESIDREVYGQRL